MTKLFPSLGFASAWKRTVTWGFCEEPKAADPSARTADGDAELHSRTFAGRKAICNPAALSVTVSGMKKLFILAALPLAAAAIAAPAKSEKAPQPQAIQPAPSQPRSHKPGFWERAWDSSVKGTQRVGRTMTRPFRRSDEKPGELKGWRNLAMNMTMDPESVKLATLARFEWGCP
jgi:hypothetical protein